MWQKIKGMYKLYCLQVKQSIWCTPRVCTWTLSFYNLCGWCFCQNVTNVQTFFWWQFLYSITLFYILNCASSNAIDRFPPGKLDIHFPTVVNVCRYYIQWHFKPPTLNSCESHLKFFPRFTQCNPREYYVNRGNELLMRGTDSQSEGTLLFLFLKSPCTFRTFVFGFRDHWSLLW